MTMDIAEDKTGNILLLQLKGRLDASTSGALEGKLMGSIGGGERQIVLDCSHLDYVSSAGLRVLLIAAKKLNTANGKLVLASLKDHVREVFDLAGFTDIFSLFPSREEAVKGLQ